MPLGAIRGVREAVLDMESAEFDRTATGGARLRGALVRTETDRVYNGEAISPLPVRMRLALFPRGVIAGGRDDAT